MSYTRSGRKLVYPGETLFDTDVLLGEFYKMMDIGWVSQAVLASGLSSPIVFASLPCTPVTGLTVNVGPGAGWQNNVADATTFGGLGGGLPADTTDSIFKLYLSLASGGTNNFTLTNNLTSGQFVYYMIEAQLVTADVNPQPRQYYNLSNPSSPITQTEPETRQDYITFRLVEGTPSSSNPPPVPTADAGWTGLYLILLQFGQVTVTSGDISQYPGTIFVNESLTQKISQTTADARYVQISKLQNGQYVFASDTGTVNTLVANPIPTYPALSAGMGVKVKVANTNTASATLNVSSLGAITIKCNSPGGQLSLNGGEMVSGCTYEFVYDGTFWVIENPSALPAYQGILTQNATQTYSFASGVAQLVQFNTVSYDPFGLFTGSPTFGYTIKIPGVYLVEAQYFCPWNNTMNGNYVALIAYKNSSSIGVLSQIPLDHNDVTLNGLLPVICAAGDVLQIYFENDTGVSITAGGPGGSTFSLSYLGTHS